MHCVHQLVSFPHDIEAPPKSNESVDPSHIGVPRGIEVVEDHTPRKPFLLGTNCPVGTRSVHLKDTPVREYVCRTSTIREGAARMKHLLALVVVILAGSVLAEDELTRKGLHYIWPQ